ncbi:flagellar motor switch phosphatase FliY [Evansella cellulosilytica]|uniref:CheC, inhibitor of MCP methylation / FliN fusion protein n=1 Tax=Evansella cellulosilytica (strain ATCC 21833 / DSM 2522 / FERM P-1141 / JCM 9156 / N-4) TaxID=649639 RepID=E6TSV5_EVAC2|nr:flagellar motor switch phosphatase FliY [Evansella cellulosilytica]ADU30747.1 CheC, inhibitor of MCP methylation / FliN fusion protein [Evansella cellulosilytica DSM 2522]
MSDMLSQEEINALLNGINLDEDDKDTEEKQESTINIEDYLSSIEQDALGEIGNISFGSSATALSTLLNQKVDITTPRVSIVKSSELDQQFPKPHIAVSVQYTVGFEGMNLLVIKNTDAAIIADLMLGNDGTNAGEELGEMQISAVQEAMNQMMGSASTSMSQIFNKRVDISPPDVEQLNLKEDPDKVTFPDDDVMLQISFDLKVGTLIDSKIMQLVSVEFAKDMVDQLLNPEPIEDITEKDANVNTQPVEETVTQQAFPQTNEQPQMDATNQHQSARQEPQFVSNGSRLPDRSAEVQPAAFSNFETPQLGNNEAKNLDMLLDIPLEVTVELGRTKRSIKDILELTQGSIIELDKLAGEPVDILVNQRLIAKGEVVVIDENFGVRVTDIVSKRERLNNL